MASVTKQKAQGNCQSECSRRRTCARLLQSDHSSADADAGWRGGAGGGGGARGTQAAAEEAHADDNEHKHEHDGGGQDRVQQPQETRA